MKLAGIGGSRTTWTCAECGRECHWTQVDCHSDECEVSRRLTEDEEAIPLPVKRSETAIAEEKP